MMVMVMVILPFFVFSPSLGFLEAVGWTVHHWALGLPEQLRGFGDRLSLSWGCCTPSLPRSRCLRCIQRQVKVWRGWEQCRPGVSSLSEPHTLLQSLLPPISMWEEQGQGHGGATLHRKWKWKSLSHVQLFATPWTKQSMEFSRPEYWSG